jgi:chemotaxis protein histidine kinase CheA
MPNPLGPTDFFALEAGEYLERLARLAAADGGPPPQEFVRYARALRGSALMANQPEITRAAGALEGVARAFQERVCVWDAALAEVIGQSVDDLKRLVRQAREWTADDTARADRLSRALESISGRPPEGSRPPTRSRGELNAGVRAFVPARAPWWPVPSNAPPAPSRQTPPRATRCTIS